jgi:hypothetical protein
LIPGTLVFIIYRNLFIIFLSLIEKRLSTLYKGRLNISKRRFDFPLLRMESDGLTAETYSCSDIYGTPSLFLFLFGKICLEGKGKKKSGDISLNCGFTRTLHIAPTREKFVNFSLITLLFSHSFQLT